MIRNPRIVFSIVFAILGQWLFSQEDQIKQIKQVKGCNYKILYNADGSKQEEGCLIKGVKEGGWVGYGIGPKKYYYLTSYKKGLKNGAFKMYYLTGELREIGVYRNNFRVDTTITFKKNGDTIAKFVSVPTENPSTSNVTWRKYYDKNAKPGGTFEQIDGVNYMWRLGEMTEFILRKN